MDVVLIQEMGGPLDMQCTFWTRKSMVFPIVSNMQQEVRFQKEEENGKILVTLPLLLEKPSSEVSTYQDADDEAQLRFVSMSLLYIHKSNKYLYINEPVILVLSKLFCGFLYEQNRKLETI